MMGMTFTKPKLQLVEDLEQLTQEATRAVTDALPKIADKARQTGKQVADIASAAADRVAHDPHVQAATAAVLSSGRVQNAGRGVLRFARRRPALLIAGGIAVVSLLVVLGRHEKNKGGAPEEDAMGEGSYKGARDYRDRTKDFLKSQGRNVAKRAKEAEAALESGERTALEAAEEEGRRHARS